MNFHDIKDLDHAPAIANALGQMVVAWARAETQLMMTLSYTTGIGLNKTLTMFYRIPTFAARTQLIKALLAEHSTESARKPLIDAVDKLAKLSVTRNGWIHGVWCANEDLSMTVIFDFRAVDGSTRRRREIKPVDIENHVSAVKARTTDLAWLVPKELPL